MSCHHLSDISPVCTCVFFIHGPLKRRLPPQPEMPMPACCCSTARSRVWCWLWWAKITQSPACYPLAPLPCPMTGHHISTPRCSGEIQECSLKFYWADNSEPSVCHCAVSPFLNPRGPSPAGISWLLCSSSRGDLEEANIDLAGQQGHSYCSAPLHVEPYSLSFPLRV